MNTSEKIVLDGRYSVDSNGTVYSLRYNNTLEKRPLKPLVLKNGYLQVRIAGTPISVHRIVAMAFIPNPEGKPTVNHLDGNKQNNKSTNLEWATHKENSIHSFSIGTSKGNPRTEKVRNACRETGRRNRSIPMDLVNEIKKELSLIKRGYGYRARTARKFSVKIHVIDYILSGGYNDGHEF